MEIAELSRRSISKALSRILLEGRVIGTIVPQNSRWGLTNGYKIIEVIYERDLRTEQKPG